MLLLWAAELRASHCRVSFHYRTFRRVNSSLHRGTIQSSVWPITGMGMACAVYAPCACQSPAARGCWVLMHNADVFDSGRLAFIEQPTFDG
jgi:hypothetical protein